MARKVEMKRRQTREQRSVTYSKRHKGLFKRAQELHSLTGASVAVLAFSPGGRPDTCGYPASFDDTVARYFHSLGDVHDETVISPGETLAWVDGIHAEGCNDLEEISRIKQKLEEINMWLVMQIENDFVNGLAV